MKSAPRDEGLGCRKSCLTEAVSLGKRHNLLATVPLNLMISNVPLVPKLYFWIVLVSICTKVGSMEKEMTQKCNRGKSESDSDIPNHKRRPRHGL